MEQVQCTFSLVNEITATLSGKEDEECFQNIQNILLEEQKLQDEQGMAVKNLIEKLMAVENEAKSLNSAASERQNRNDKVDMLKAEKSETSERVKQMESEVNALENISKQKEFEEKNLKAKNDEISTKKDEVLPKTKYFFSLFSNISHIRWDYNSKEDEIKGFVASLDDVKPFCLNANQNSKYYTANYLWDLIDA